MKLIRTLFLAAIALLVTNIHAQEATAKWINSISIAPVAVLQTEGINGESTFGAGLDAGVGFNQYVSAHLALYSYENNNWRGGVIDEIEAYGKGKISLTKSISLTGKGGAIYDPLSEDYALAVGAGLELALSETVSLGADYTIRAWFQGREKDSLLRGFVQLSF